AFLVALGALLAGGAAAAAIGVQAGIGFVAVTGASAGAEMMLDDAHQMEVGRGTVDRLGSLLFRDLAPGSGHGVRDTPAGRFVSDPVTVPPVEGRPDARPD